MLMWDVKVVNIVGGNENRKETPMAFHICTDEDYDEFFPPNIDAKPEFERMREKKQMYCLDDSSV